MHPLLCTLVLDGTKLENAKLWTGLECLFSRTLLLVLFEVDLRMRSCSVRKPLCRFRTKNELPYAGCRFKKMIIFSSHVSVESSSCRKFLNGKKENLAAFGLIENFFRFYSTVFMMCCTAYSDSDTLYLLMVKLISLYKYNVTGHLFLHSL